MGPIPRCSSQAIRRVRSDAPIAAQTSLRYKGVFGFVPMKSSNRATMTLWRRLPLLIGETMPSLTHLTTAWISSCSSARTTSGSSNSSGAVLAMPPTISWSLRKRSMRFGAGLINWVLRPRSSSQPIIVLHAAAKSFGMRETLRSGSSPPFLRAVPRNRLRRFLRTRAPCRDLTLRAGLR